MSFFSVYFIHYLFIEIYSRRGSFDSDKPHMVGEDAYAVANTRFGGMYHMVRWSGERRYRGKFRG